MKCSKCIETRWIEIEGVPYCRQHGEVKIADMRIGEERKRNPPRETPTDGLVYIKMKHQGVWVTVRGRLNSMDVREVVDKMPVALGVAKSHELRIITQGNRLLTLEIAPTEIRRWQNDPDDIPLSPKDAA